MSFVKMWVVKGPGPTDIAYNTITTVKSDVERIADEFNLYYGNKDYHVVQVKLKDIADKT